MNRKKYFVTAIILNAALLEFGASCCQHLTSQTQRGANVSERTALPGPGGKFGPVIEKILTAAKPDGRTEILDLETGRALVQPPFEYFNYNADAIVGWIRTNGLDISCFVLPGVAACVTYDMTIVAVEGKCWEEAKEEELLAKPDLAPKRHSPRRLLVLGQNRPDTYIFRTGEGTLGMLRIVGVSENGQGVKIRYKLINPAKSVVAAGLSQS